MSGFKDTTRTMQGFHHWSGGAIGGGGTGGTINRLARGGPVDKIDSNPGHAEVYPKEGDRMHGNSATQRKESPTQELTEHGGKTPLISKFKKGGPTKHFHVHKHFHAKGGKTHTVSHSYSAAEKHAETFAEGGHVHDSTHIPAGSPDYAKGGKTGNWIKGAIKHPGAFKAKAKHAGMSTSAYASKVTKPGSHASTQTKRQANLAKTLGKVRPVKKNAGGALYAPGGSVSKPALGGVPMVGATPAVGALGRLATRPQGLPMRPGLPMRRPMALPGPQPLMRAQGGKVHSDAAQDRPMMERIAKQAVGKHVRTAPPRGHGVR